MSNNQTPEQQARNDIDRKLKDSGWIVQAKNKINWTASRGIAVKEYLTDVGPADYVLFVDKKSAGIIEAKQAGTLKFNEDQMNWLRMIKDYVATSFHLEIDDLDYTPFDALGGRGRMYQLFGDEMNMVISELNEILAA